MLILDAQKQKASLLCLIILTLKIVKIFDNLRQSSEMFGECSETFVWPWEQFWKIFGKWSEIFGKSSETLPYVCLYHKQNITCPLVDTNFIVSCSTRYRVEHWKIKFVSTRGHVISSISLHALSYRGIHTDVIVYIFCSFAYGFAYKRKHVRYELIPGLRACET